MKIRSAGPSDAPAIQQVLRSTWQDTYGSYLSPETLDEVYKNWQSIEFLTRQIEHPEIYFPLAEVDDKVVGLATARLDSETITLFRLYVLPDYQRQHIGRQLLENVMDRFSPASKIRLSVEKMNDKGKQFYERMGFKIVGEGQDKVGDQVIHEYHMQKELI